MLKKHKVYSGDIVKFDTPSHAGFGIYSTFVAGAYGGHITNLITNVVATDFAIIVYTQVSFCYVVLSSGAAGWVSKSRMLHV